ncbi:MAG: hypothetical protein QXN55_04890 [Candidatus Nitrosotenuis sp.]
MNLKQGLVALSLTAFALMFPANTIFADQPSLTYHGKNVIESPPEFTGRTLHFIINDDMATVVYPGEGGLEVTRMNITPSDVCIQTESTLCFDAEVTEVKNSQIHHVGDKISFTLDLANKRQIGTAKSGSMEGMIVTMKIDRMFLKSGAPYTISVTREGGFAAFAPKTMTFDPLSNIITITEGEDITTVPLEDKITHEIDQLFQKSKLLNMESQNYPPNEGSADYFTYSLVLDQGAFQREFSWTDASDGAPQTLRELQNKIWTEGEQNKPIPVDITYDEQTILDIAKEFVLSAPTFAFDGMKDTLEFGPITVLESFPEQYKLDATFTSAHGGYGNRTGQMVTQALTPHTMNILISEGTVISAVTDETWDELNHQFVLKTP